MTRKTKKQKGKQLHKIETLCIPANVTFSEKLLHKLNAARAREEDDDHVSDKQRTEIVQLFKQENPSVQLDNFSDTEIFVTLIFD